MPPRVHADLLDADEPSPPGLFARTFTGGQVADALLASRQALVDLVRRGGLEVGDMEGGRRRLSFVDTVLFRIAEHRARYMDAKTAAALANALRPFAERLASRCLAAGVGALAELAVDMPVALAHPVEGSPAPRWRVDTFDTLEGLGRAFIAHAEDMRKAAEVPDDEPASWRHSELLRPDMVCMAPEFHAVAVALTRVGVEPPRAGVKLAGAGSA